MDGASDSFIVIRAISRSNGDSVITANRAAVPTLLPVRPLVPADRPIHSAINRTSRADRAVAIALRLFTSGVCLFAVAYLLYACLPYTVVRAFADRLSSDGNAQSFTYARHHEMRLGAAAAALAAGIVAAFLLRGLRTPLAQRSAWRAAIASDLRSVLRCQPRAEHLVVLALSVLALILRLLYIHYPLRYDEAFTYDIAATGLLRTLSDYTYPNNHILHTILVYLGTRIANHSEWAIRLPAVLAGISVCLLIYIAARRLFSRQAAIVALALAATCPGLIGYSVTARGYMIQTVFSLLLLLIAVRWRTDSSFAPRAYFTVVAALSMYLLLTSVYIILFAVIVLVAPSADKAHPLAAKLRGLVPCVVFAGALTTFLYSPALIYSGLNAFVANRFVTAVDNRVFTLASSFQEAALVSIIGWPWVLVAIVGLGVSLSLLHQGGRRLALGLFAIVTFALIQGGDPPSRIWTFAIPAILLMAGEGIARILKRPGIVHAAVAAIVITGAAGAVSPTAMAQMDYMLYNAPLAPEFAAFLNQRMSDRDAVFVDIRYGPSLRYYMSRLRKRTPVFDVDTPRPVEVLYVVCDQPVCTWHAQTGSEGADEGFALHDPGHDKPHHGLDIADRRYRRIATSWNGGTLPALTEKNRIWFSPYAAIHAVRFNRQQTATLR